VPGECEAAEEEGGVEGVAGEGVEEEGQASCVAGDEPRGGFGEASEEGPDAEVGDEEELDSAYEGYSADASYRAVVADSVAKGHVDQEAGVDEGMSLWKPMKMSPANRATRGNRKAKRRSLITAPAKRAMAPTGVKFQG